MRRQTASAYLKSAGIGVRPPGGRRDGGRKTPANECPPPHPWTSLDLFVVRALQKHKSQGFHSFFLPLCLAANSAETVKSPCNIWRECG